jgi:hypothetical protein
MIACLVLGKSSYPAMSLQPPFVPVHPNILSKPLILQITRMTHIGALVDYSPAKFD